MANVFEDLGKFGTALLGSVNDAVGVSENSPTSLEELDPSLSGFFERIDRSAQRQYLEDGFLRNRPRTMEILSQEPDMTVVVKKRMFSSLASSYKPELMDKAEKLFYRASKRLFFNKCKAIAAYEKLSKVEKVIKNAGAIDEYMLPLIFSSIDALDAVSNVFKTSSGGKVKSVFDTIRRVKSFSEPSSLTTWIVDRNLPGLSELGEGNGVFELTMVSSMSSRVATEFGAGSGTLSIEDPYKLMWITDEDIYKAIRETCNSFSNNAFFKISEAQLEETNEMLNSKLYEMRQARGASGIRFFFNETSLLFKKIRAVIDEEGREIIFHYDGGILGIDSSVQLDPSAEEGVNGLKGEEVSLFKQILCNYYILFGIRNNSQTTSFFLNKENEYALRKMRLHFSGKYLIQPMDVVNIFVSSKSSYDSRIGNIVKNNLSAGDILNSIGDTIDGISSSLDNLTSTFGGAQNYAVLEKDAIAGPEFPMWLWTIMRNDFTRQAAGTHVFAGLVKEVSHEYSGGKYTLSVSIADNTHYFELGKININPSVDVYNGALYDPLTPYDLQFDASTGAIKGETPSLLPENISLLNAGLIKFKNGRMLGQQANQKSYHAVDGELTSDGRFRRVFHDPDGLVYRWKEGIQTLTYNSAAYSQGLQKSDTSPNLFKSSFAGQDVMNILSLLVTGQPYNFNTFLRSAINSGAFSRDDLKNETSSNSFLKGLINQLNKQNQIWGNFVPFKKLSINEEAYAFLKSGELDLSTSSRKISSKLKERAQRFDQLVKVSNAFANNPQFLHADEKGNLTNVSPAINNLDLRNQDVTQISKLTKDIAVLDLEIYQEQKAFEETLKNSNIAEQPGAIRIFGDDISYDPSFSENGATSTDIYQRNRNEFRRKLNLLTQRRLWKVKANEDPNLFIVDDSYDKNYDIQAFSKALADFSLFQSGFSSVKEQISMVSKLLELEVFADTQGHIQVRPPQYNRVPSSVFYKLLEEKDVNGIRLFPSYLESLFTNQLSGAVTRLEIIEDEIRIRARALGYVDDYSAESSLLRGSPQVSGAGYFKFLTNELTGLFGNEDIRKLIDQGNQDSFFNRRNALEKTESKLKNQISNISNFDILQQAQVVNSVILGNNVNESVINQKINDIGVRLSKKTNKPIQTRTSLFSSNNFGGARSQLDTLMVTEQISKFVSERQSIIKVLNNIVKNLMQAEIANDPENSRSLLNSFTSRSKEFPEILEHMIEYEDFDDYGWGAGKRFVIKDSQILSMSIKESEPEFVMAQVNGLFAEGLAEADPNLSTENGGNHLVSASAVDFDLWKMYGLRSAYPVDAPYFSDPDTQCAPYAVFLLNRARKNIFRGSVTIAGNEFIQPGEVYYFEDRNLLFYANSVSHSFSYGQFSTTIDLSYGHVPGEYIPTPLDIIGKSLYVNKHQADLIRHNRYDGAVNQTALNTLVAEQPTSLSDDTFTTLVAGTYGEQNVKSLTNVVLALNGVLPSPQADRRPVVELRTYYNSLKGVPQNSSLTSVAGHAVSWIMNPTQRSLQDGSFLSKDVQAQTFQINPNDLRIKSYDLASSNVSPSQAAWNKARELRSSGTSNLTGLPPTTNGDPAEFELYNKVIDIWVVYEEIPKVAELSQAQGLSQSAQEVTAKIDAIFSKIKSS